MGSLKAIKPRLGTLRSPMGYGDREQSERARLRKREQLDHWRVWYKTKAWHDLRLFVFARDGYTCRQTGVLLTKRHPHEFSPVCDHIVPHRGDPKLFWDPDNLQTVSKSWHDSVKQSQERGGR